MTQRAIFHRAADALASWTRFSAIVTVIVLNGMFEEALILGAEFMMLVRWTRDVVRYDVRWMVQEKARLLTSRRPREGRR